MRSTIRNLGVALAVMLVSAAVVAGSASAAAKPVLKLKQKGVLVPNGTAVGGGWTGAIETGKTVGAKETIYTYYGCETQGAMTLVTNAATTDKATGSVGVPHEECGYFEVSEETSSPSIARRHRSARRVRRKAGGARPNVVTTTVTPTAGVMTTEEMTTKKTGTVGLSTPLAFEEVTGSVVCKYTSKTKLKGEWPVEEFPGTADLEAEFVFKLVKGSAKTCVKAPEGFIEAWVGPDFEELEAEIAV